MAKKQWFPEFPADFPLKSSHQDLILLFHRFAHPTERGGRLSCGELKQLLRAVQGDDETEPELPEGFPERLYEAWAPQGVPLKLGLMTSGYFWANHFSHPCGFVTFFLSRGMVGGSHMTYGFRNVEDEIMLCDELWRLIMMNCLFFKICIPKSGVKMM